MDNYELVHIDGFYGKSEYVKSNILIGAKYSSSLLENKLIALSLANVDNFYPDESGALVSMISVSTIKKLMNKKGNSLYDQIDEAAQNMQHRVFGIRDPENNRFDYMALIIRARLENGKFYLYFSPFAKDYILDLKNKFTKLSLPTMISFKSVYTFRLYELLKSKYYKERTINYSVAELKLEMGIVNADLEAVRKELKGKNTPDFEKAVEVSPEKKLESWREFKRVALDVAVSEINQSELTDILVDYRPVRKGRGGKITDLVFEVTPKNDIGDVSIMKQEEVSVSDEGEDKDILLLQIAEILTTTFSLKETKAIAEAAGYDVSKVKTAYDILTAQKNKIENPVGFMMAAIKYDFEKAKPQKSKNSFIEYKQNKYDYDALLEMIKVN